MDYKTQTRSVYKYFVRLLILVFCVIFFRLFYIQIIQHDYYRDLANSEQIKRLIIPADRGLIYGLDGDLPVKLVMNDTVYKVFADPMIIDQEAKIIETVKEIAKDKTRQNIESLLSLKSTRYQVLATDLTRYEADKIKSKGFKGIGFQASSKRVYPEGDMAAQVLGFVDYMGEGRYGVEGFSNDELKGKDGLLQSVTDIRDVPLTIGSQNIKQPKQDGKNIVLTLDRNIQAQAELAAQHSYDIYKSKFINILVMDPNNGQIKAMVNFPGYNPGSYNKVSNQALYNNNIISRSYEPGSVMKTFTIVKAIDKGLITADTKYNNTDYVQVDDRTISNATKGHTGLITMQDAYNWSLNTGMVEIMKIFGGGSINSQSRELLYDFLTQLGFGDTTGIELTGEVAGTVVGPNTGNGDAVRYSNMSFGQGINVSMIQTVAAYSAVINGGKYYQPTIIAGSISSNGDFIKNGPKLKKQNIVSPQASKILREMSVKARIVASNKDPIGYMVGGKTGTSQVIKDGIYSDSETIGSYIGFGGNADAKYVIMVTEYGEGQNARGFQNAMPVFNELSNWLINYLNIQPKE